ncbi:MAG: hypothetical protein WC547_00365 [Candidatus Omnitrophota bacterium]
MSGAGIKKVVYFVTGPFSRRDHARFGIGILEKNGFDVEVWDFAPFLYPRARENAQEQDTADYARLRVFNIEQEALNAIASLSAGDCFVVCFVPYGLNTFYIFRRLSSRRVKYAVFMANALPLSACSSYKLSDIIRNISLKEAADKLRRFTPARIMESVFFKTGLGVLGIEPAYFRLAGGSRSAVTAKFPVNSRTRTLWMHTLDYDLYLDELRNPPSVDDRQAVFLDEYIPFHPGYDYLGVKPFITDAGEYYGLLCAFFKNLEDSYNLHIVVAAHPRAHYERHRDFFQGRPVLKGRTPGLIRNSSFVIGHVSTSVNYAVLFKKPVIFVTTDELDKSVEGVWIHNIASFFGKRVYNLNKVRGIDLAEELTVDRALYDTYKDSYIKRAGSQDLPFWQIVAQGLKEI